MHLQWQYFIFISLLLTFIHPAIGQSWNYNDLGPDVWSDTYPSCAGRFQSPINIRTACTTYQPLTPFSFSSAYELTHNFTLTNNGYSLIGRYDGSDASPFKLTGGGLQGTFEFTHFHFHWGENYKSGSEHQINGAKYTGEIHFVHINPETSEPAVLGFFMQSNPNTTFSKTTYIQKRNTDIYNTTNTTINEWKIYFAAAANLQVSNDSTVVSLNLASFMGGNLDDFWRYKGSLTTPPCTEGVIWSLFKIPIVLSEKTITVLRKNLLLEGYRDPQPLYNRIVHRNFPDETLSSISDYHCCSKGSNNYTNQILIIYLFLFLINK